MGLVNWFHCSLPDRALVLGQLKKSRAVLPLNNQLIVGHDNIHADVYLSFRFQEKLESYIHTLASHEVDRCVWKKIRTDEENVFAASLFHERYRKLLEYAVRLGDAEKIQILQAAVVLMLFRQVEKELDLAEDFFRQTEFHQGQKIVVYSDQSLDHLQQLQRYRQNIRYRICRRVLKGIHQIEAGQLRKTRKSLLGLSWPLAEVYFFNPLLTLSADYPLRYFARHFPLCLRPGDSDIFQQVEAVLLEILAPWLPDPVVKPGSDVINPAIDVDSDFVHHRNALQSLLFVHPVRPAELQQEESGWFDVAENIAVLFDPSTHDAGHQWRRLQNCLYRRVYRKLKKRKLLYQVYASQMLAEIHAAMDRQVDIAQLWHFLTSREGRGDCQKKPGLMLAMKYRRKLDRYCQSLRKMNYQTGRPLIISFLKHFIRYRRDLKAAHHFSAYLEQFHLLENDQQLLQARTKGTFYEFALPDDVNPQSLRRIRHHVIIKADVRGSTELTAEMLKKRLNPASYFSLNLFQPVNDVLESCEAEKIFVEGDAVILGLMEYEDDARPPMSVTFACMLAENILGIVAKKNIENQRHGLPAMELGIGISYIDEAPTFIYDGDHRITISPAINRADRLSSCDAHLRLLMADRIHEGENVQVVVQPDQNNEEKLLRYNVGGIELDAPAFYKLKSETSFHTVSGSGLPEGELFHISRYPDLNGNFFWLVIREAPVKQWLNPGLGENDVNGRRFYEVITDPGLVRQVKDGLGPQVVKQSG